MRAKRPPPFSFSDDADSGSTYTPKVMPMVRKLISLSALLSVGVWLGYSFLDSPSKSTTKVAYDVVAKTSDHGRSFIIRDTTIKPGGALGWHWHYRSVLAVVKEGTLSHVGSDCTVDATYRAGDSFVDPGGPDHVHDGRNLGAVPVVLEVVYAAPSGTPLEYESNPPLACR